VPHILASVRAIVHSMTDNPFFPAPEPSLDTVQAAVLALSDAQAVAATRAHGTVAARNVRLNDLRIVLAQLRSYVQKTADGSTQSAAQIIESAGLHVHKSAAYEKPRFHARQGALSGTVKLTAESAKGQAFYEWQLSTDGGASWIRLDTTWKSHLDVRGLPVGKAALFQFRATTRKRRWDWSQPVGLLVG
jgi:hypothetical protein